MLQLCSGIGHIPDPDRDLPPWTVDVYTDSPSGAWKGMKGVGPASLPGGLLSFGRSKSTETV